MCSCYARSQRWRTPNLWPSYLRRPESSRYRPSDENVRLVDHGAERGAVVYLHVFHQIQPEIRKVKKTRFKQIQRFHVETKDWRGAAWWVSWCTSVIVDWNWSYRGKLVDHSSNTIRVSAFCLLQEDGTHDKRVTNCGMNVLVPNGLVIRLLWVNQHGRHYRARGWVLLCRQDIQTWP